VPNDLGKTIRILRQAKKLSTGDLATKSGVTSPFISLVEKGNRQPSLEVLRQIAKALEVPSEALVLMAFGRESGLKSDDSAASSLADTVGKMIEMELQLSRLLDAKESGHAKEPDHPS